MYRSFEKKTFDINEGTHELKRYSVGVLVFKETARGKHPFALALEELPSTTLNGQHKTPPVNVLTNALPPPQEHVAMPLPLVSTRFERN